jgi:hypothetical protein
MIKQWSEGTKREFKGWEEEQKKQALFLEKHPDYPGYLLVNGIDPLYPHRLKGVINEYCALPILKLNDLTKRANEEGFSSLFFIGDPGQLQDYIASLDDPYPYSLPVELKQFQLRGFNYTKDLPSSIINWSTGTGKSIYSIARAKYLLEEGQVDKIVVLSKSHNKINWKRTFEQKGAMEASVDDENSIGGTPARRRESRASMYQDSTIFIINYEKMRYREKETAKRDSTGRKRPDPSGDGQELEAALKGQRVFWIWDEMPNKMKSMNTAWYRGAEKLLRRTKKNWQVELTAKKLDTDPENVYSCVRILDKTIWSSKAVFRNSYAKRMSSFSPWQVASWDTKKLPELGMRLSHMTHIANKYTDPDIRAEFPEDHWEDVIIDMTPEDRRLYDVIEKGIIDEMSGDYTELITKILPLQFVCNNPQLINKARGQLAHALRENYKWTDKHCAKLEVLHDMLQEVDGKVVIFTMFNEFGMKMLSPYLTSWGISHVLFTGSNKQKQIAQDRFRENPRIKVFLSSDAGSDSIDLEQATTVINYDLPWNHSTLVQRVNRISRLTSEADHVFYYNFITAHTLEERKLRVLSRKRRFEEAIDSEISEQSELISHGSLDELKWIVTG